MYSLSFSRVFRRGPHTDYVNVEGLPGVHIANELNPIAFAQASVRGLMDESDLEKFLGTRVTTSSFLKNANPLSPSLLPH